MQGRLGPHGGDVVDVPPVPLPSSPHFDLTCILMQSMRTVLSETNHLTEIEHLLPYTHYVVLLSRSSTSIEELLVVAVLRPQSRIVPGSLSRPWGGETYDTMSKQRFSTSRQA
jgi:hypothetical protein